MLARRLGVSILLIEGQGQPYVGFILNIAVSYIR